MTANDLKNLLNFKGTTPTEVFNVPQERLKFIMNALSVEADKIIKEYKEQQTLEAKETFELDKVRLYKAAVEAAETPQEVLVAVNMAEFKAYKTADFLNSAASSLGRLFEQFQEMTKEQKSDQDES